MQEPSEHELNRLKKWVNCFLALTIIGTVLTASTALYRKYNPSGYYFSRIQNSAKSRQAALYEMTLNGQKLYIPFIYFDVPAAHEDKSVLLHATLPDLRPVTERPREIYKHHEVQKIALILIDRGATDEQFMKMFHGAIQRDEAYRVVGKQYGLTYQTQEEGNPKDWGELWIETDDHDRMSSYVDCEKPLGKGFYPSCKHYFRYQNMLFKVNYNKDYLPQWKTIESEVKALFDSFYAQDTAYKYLQEKLVSVQEPTRKRKFQ